MSQIAAILAFSASLWQLALCSSFKLESMGMLVQGNVKNSTTIEHRRPLTNVKTIVDQPHLGQLQDLAAFHHPVGKNGASQLCR